MRVSPMLPMPREMSVTLRFLAADGGLISYKIKRNTTNDNDADYNTYETLDPDLPCRAGGAPVDGTPSGKPMLVGRSSRAAIVAAANAELDASRHERKHKPQTLHGLNLRHLQKYSLCARYR